MKNKCELIICLVIVIISIIFATLVNNKSKYINYTFYINNKNTINIYDNYGNILVSNLVYSETLDDDYILIVNNNKECAIIDKLGDFIINYGEYDSIEEYGKLYLAYKDSDIFLITGSNTLVRKLERKEELVSLSVKNYAVLLFDNEYHIYNSNGEQIFSREYKKNKRITFKESKNYGLIYYNSSEYLFNINETTYEERKVDSFSDIEENNNYLVISGENNRVYYKGELQIENFTCPYITIDSSVKCENTIIYEPDYYNLYNGTITNYGDFNVVCNKTCSLYNESKLLLDKKDEIKVLTTDLNTYFYTKKGNKISIYNESLKEVFNTKKNIKLKRNYLEIDSKFYTFEGNEIIL